MLKSLFLLALVTGTLLSFSITMPPVFTAEANSNSSRISSAFENYDIRTDNAAASSAKLRELRGTRRDDLPMRATGATAGPQIEFNDNLGVAEIISPAVAETFLTRSPGSNRSVALKDFVIKNRPVFGVSDPNQLVNIADYSNPNGNLAFAHFRQEIGNLPVFGAEVKAGFDRDGGMFRVINTLAPGLNASSLSANFGSPDTAIVKASSHVGITVASEDLSALSIQKPGEHGFSSYAFADMVLVEQFYFPIGNGEARPAWRVSVPTSTSTYYVIVDAEDGTLLWRKNLVEHQAIPATYNVYGNSTSLLKTADSPSPFSPGCVAPTGCPQPPVVARTSFTLVGNEVPYVFNDLGWIPDAGLAVRVPADPNITDGNSVEAGIDRAAPNGVDENGWAFGSPARVFNYSYNPGPGLPPPGEEPLPVGPQPYPPTAFQQGVVAHGFYLANRWHDEMYRLGFNEQARNFQHFNFGRGGIEGDRISFEMQDSSGTNGANFFVPADGNRPRLQMMIWPGSTPDRDGALDAQVVLHEITHGMSIRLHGNTTGLSSNMARGMGEGWSDFYAFALLSEATDDRLGTHALGGYITHLLLAGFEANYYYGLRRFPVAVRASIGPNGLPHNPLTFGYINSGCNTLIGTDSTNPNSAYPRGPIGSSSPCDQIHNLGEVWAVTLWEVRDQLVQRHGTAEGNRRALQYITDGMKLSPLNPTVVQSRDAILSATAFSDSTDVGPVWCGFAIRGLGQSASVTVAGSGANNTVVNESFSLPLQFRRPARADFDSDGRSDVSVFRPSDRVWYLNRSSTGFAAVTWGLATDKPIPDDFDGDGKSDFAVFRATADGAMPDYYIFKSATSTIDYVSWGTTGDIALTEDFDGDGKADPTIFRPSTGRFWVRRSIDGSTMLSRPMPGSVAFVGDFDGDGRGDFGTYDNGMWMLIRSGDGYAFGTITNWGLASDKLVPGDYDGDGKDDLAVYRPSTGTWYIANSAGGTRITNFGISTDIPVPADYDGDGRTDIAVYRDGVWYINNSMGGIVITSFGLAEDTPLPASYLP